MEEDPIQTSYYLSPAVERAMKIREVILRAIEGRIKLTCPQKLAQGIS